MSWLQDVTVLSRVVVRKKLEYYCAAARRRDDAENLPEKPSPLGPVLPRGKLCLNVVDASLDLVNGLLDALDSLRSMSSAFQRLAVNRAANGFYLRGVVRGKRGVHLRLKFQSAGFKHLVLASLDCACGQNGFHLLVRPRQQFLDRRDALREKRLVL